MKKFRTFEVSDETVHKMGYLNIRMDEEETSVFKKLKNIGFNINKRKNKLIWWDDDYAEVINKRTDKTVGMLEIVY